MDKPYIDRTDYTCGEEQGAPSEGVAVGNLPGREIEPDKAVAGLFFDTMAAANRAGKDALSRLLEKLHA